MPFARIRDMNLYYEELGKPEGETLFLLNGAFGALDTPSDWSNQLPKLAEQYRVVTYEHRGHGRTDNPLDKFDNYTTLADDAIALLEYLDIPKAHMLGFSDGAITLIDLVIRRPDLVDTLVLVGANYYVDPAIAEAMDILLPEYMEEKHPAWAQTLVRHHDAHQGAGHWKKIALQMRVMWTTEPNYADEQIAGISVPTLVMTGQYDPFGTIEQNVKMNKLIKGSELCIVPGAAHGVLNQRPEISTLLILNYLDRARRKKSKGK
jgi:pimeloyl-ACP methyl ester carboxylesterase